MQAPAIADWCTQAQRTTPSRAASPHTHCEHSARAENGRDRVAARHCGSPRSALVAADRHGRLRLALRACVRARLRAAGPSAYAAVPSATHSLLHPLLPFESDPFRERTAAQRPSLRGPVCRSAHSLCARALPSDVRRAVPCRAAACAMHMCMPVWDIAVATRIGVAEERCGGARAVERIRLLSSNAATDAQLHTRRTQVRRARTEGEGLGSPVPSWRLEAKPTGNGRSATACHALHSGSVAAIPACLAVR
jgi:hypothetical protein